MCTLNSKAMYNGIANPSPGEHRVKKNLSSLKDYLHQLITPLMTLEKLLIYVCTVAPVQPHT